jgi:hypothetical protein
MWPNDGRKLMISQAVWAMWMSLTHQGTERGRWVDLLSLRESARSGISEGKPGVHPDWQAGSHGLGLHRVKAGLAGDPAEETE